jgi:hypothetical protein
MYAAVWLDGHVQVVTNDEMRDHHFQMLSQRAFQRWKERHQTHYNFTFHPSLGRKVLETFQATSFSIRMQVACDRRAADAEASTNPEDAIAIHVPALRNEAEERADFVGESRGIEPSSVTWLCARRPI